MTSGPTLSDRILAVVGRLSLAAFTIAGFLGGSAWSWISFLPGIVYAGARAEGRG